MPCPEYELEEAFVAGYRQAEKDLPHVNFGEREPTPTSYVLDAFRSWVYAKVLS